MKKDHVRANYVVKLNKIKEEEKKHKIMNDNDGKQNVLEGSKLHSKG